MRKTMLCSVLATVVAMVGLASAPAQAQDHAMHRHMMHRAMRHEMHREMRHHEMHHHMMHHRM